MGLSRALHVSVDAPASAWPVVETVDLTVGHGHCPVLSSVNLVVRPGQRVAIVGKNGAGKSTLLRVLGGLAAPVAGSIRWSGGLLAAGPARVRTVGFLFQGEARAPFLVRELVTLGLGLDGAPSLAGRAAVEVALARFDLRALAERPCATLSGGEWQRVTLARALVGGPRLLLLDEPATHLDLAWRADLMAALDGLRGGVAVVLATHDLDAAATGDRVLLLGGGGVVADGTPGEVLTPPLLARALGVRVRRHDPPDDGPPLFQVLGRLERSA
jgi:iron complex transport system ATP-binding protein